MRLDDLDTVRDIPVDMPDGEAEQPLASSRLEMIGELPPRYRDAILMTEIEGLTQAEMAHRLDVSLSGGKSRVQRDREKLKEMLLDCCHIEFDRHGIFVGYRMRACCEAVQTIPSRR